MLERLRDLIIVSAVNDDASHILREFPEDQLQRMRSQSTMMGTATLIRAADIAAEGLTQMRGATAPRLLLELICGRILLPGADDAGLVARVERLERVCAVATPHENVAVPASMSEPIAQAKKEVVPVKPVKSEPVVVKEAPAAPVVKPSGPIDIAGLRRFWPEVIENVKKRRRLTWSLLSASAQVISVDDKTITIGIVNAGARDSFTRSGSDEILREAFIDVTGMDRKIECVVDAEVNTPAQGRVDEDPADSNQLSGQELLMRELGAQIISKTEG